MSTLRKKVTIFIVLLLIVTLLGGCKYKNEVAHKWVEIPEGFVRFDFSVLSQENCYNVEFLENCDIAAQFSTNGDEGFLAYTHSSNGLMPVEEKLYYTQLAQGEQLYVRSFPEQSQLLAMEQSFLSIIFFEGERPVGYTLIYIAAFEIEGNKVTKEMMNDATLDAEQTYMFYIGNIVRSVKFTSESDITVNEINDRIYAMEINYLLGLR